MVRDNPGGGGDPRHGVEFLTALLVRYPAIGSAGLLGGQLLYLDLYLQQGVDEEAMAAFSRDLGDSQSLLHRLRRSGPRHSSLAILPLDAGSGDPGVIRLERDLETLSLEELRVTMEVAEEHFGQSLTSGEALEPDEASHQDDVLGESLDRLISSPVVMDLVALRQEMKVEVYLRHPGDGEAS